MLNQQLYENQINLYDFKVITNPEDVLSTALINHKIECEEEESCYTCNQLKHLLSYNQTLIKNGVIEVSINNQKRIINF
jgi:hypothetical protein